MINYYLQEQLQELKNKINNENERKISLNIFNKELMSYNYKLALDKAIKYVNIKILILSIKMSQLWLLA
jgi:hypothetical protein